MGDRRTKQALREEIELLYREREALQLRVAELESTVAVANVTRNLEELFERVKATLGAREPSRTSPQGGEER